MSAVSKDSRRRLLWALAALAVMLAPAMAHVRPWAVALVLGLIAWRLGHAFFGVPLPGRMVRAMLTLLALLGIWLSYGTLLGIVAGSALLIVMAGLKLIESRTSRDYFLLLVITLFIGLADFLYQPSVALAIYMLPALWLVVAAFVVVGHGDEHLPGRAAGRVAASLLMPALPIAAILFFVFPRIGGPIWQLPKAGPAHTGIGDSMAPGSIGKLAVSKRIAFRVRFKTSPPAKRYWRGPVLHHFDQGVWTRGRSSARLTPVQLRGKPIKYTVTLRPDDHRWLYVLATPTEWPAEATLSADYSLYTDHRVRHRRRYSVTSYPQARHGLSLPEANRRRDLQLPATGNPKARALAAHWRRALDSPRAIVDKALARFADGNYYYTLKPPALGENGIDQFLFDTKSGFCGHYASAFTFLMRAAGIPAHVVVGYAGGERNPIDGYWTVRDSRAHAWSEVWLKGIGWRRIDPTAALPANRVDPAAAAALGVASPNGARGGFHFSRGFVEAWNAANTFWNHWVMGFGPNLQKTAFAHLGVDYGSLSGMLMILVAALILILAVLGGAFASRAWMRRGEPAVRLYARFCRKLERVGLHRRPHEGPVDFAERAATRRPDIKKTVDTITRLYVALRYDPAPPQAGLRRLAAAVSNFQPERRF
jgi:transglutaminase-like putative cysteine protease